MNEYKRLTIRDEDYTKYGCFSNEPILQILKRLQEFEDKIEQGLLIELPCRVGDKFYGIQGDSYFKYTVYAIVINNKGIWLETVYEMRFLYGSDAFLTKAEAEARLQELQGEKNV